MFFSISESWLILNSLLTEISNLLIYLILSFISSMFSPYSWGLSWAKCAIIVFRGLSFVSTSSYFLTSEENDSILSLTLAKSYSKVDYMFWIPKRIYFSILSMYLLMESIILVLMSCIFFAKSSFLICFFW